MSTIKTVNVTTGKVLHYTIKKDGFKPVTGSKLITGNETININMVSSESTDGAYVFGDRLGGVATFVGYFDSVDPNTQATQKYAYFVCDAQYRTAGKGMPNVTWNWQRYDVNNVINAKESATWNTNLVYDNFSVSSGYFAPYWYSRNPNGQSLIVTVDGVPYSPQLPNAYELKQIFNNRVSLDAQDPTLTTYSSMGLSSWSFTSDSHNLAWTSNHYSSDSSFILLENNGSFTWASNWGGAVLPVFEIPVN